MRWCSKAEAEYEHWHPIGSWRISGSLYTVLKNVDCLIRLGKLLVASRLLPKKSLNPKVEIPLAACATFIYALRLLRSCYIHRLWP